MKSIFTCLVPELVLFMDRIKFLIHRHLAGTLTLSERLELDRWLSASPDNRVLFEEINDPDRVAASMTKIEALREQEMWERLQPYLDVDPQERPVRGHDHGPAVRGRIARLAPGRKWVAAAIVLVLAAGGYYLYAVRDYSSGHAPAIMASDILPGGNRATLTVAGGQVIVLDSASNGAVTVQGNTAVVKTAGGKLVYRPAAHAADVIPVFNTLSTPKGGQYQLTLPDGTRVRLNAASSLRFPTAFTGGQRNVELSGEAYFQVAADKRRPFAVSLGSMQVQVLGTEFDVMAYPDEPAARTTLVSGSVRLVDGAAHTILDPGKTAEWRDQGFQLIPADVQQVTAWRYGEWSFNRLDIREIMRQLARWYDIEVDYEGKVPDKAFGGVIHRDVNLSTVLKFLKINGIHFRQDGRRITLLP
jgi:transmembrane sensor